MKCYSPKPQHSSLSQKSPSFAEQTPPGGEPLLEAAPGALQSPRLVALPGLNGGREQEKSILHSHTNLLCSCECPVSAAVPKARAAARGCGGWWQCSCSGLSGRALLGTPLTKSQSQWGLIPWHSTGKGLTAYPGTVRGAGAPAEAAEGSGVLSHGWRFWQYRRAELPSRQPL